MTVVEPMVTATLPARDGLLRVSAKMLGRPVRAKGKPVLVEIELASGRTTLACFKTVEAENDAARALLAYVPPESGKASA